MVGKRIVGYLFFACFSLAESKDDTVTVKESPTQPAVVPTQKYNFGCKTRSIQGFWYEFCRGGNPRHSKKHTKTPVIMVDHYYRGFGIVSGVERVIMTETILKPLY